MGPRLLLPRIPQRYGDRVSVDCRQHEPGAIGIEFSVK